MRHPTTSPITRTAAILTLVALVFGLPNFLVICAPRGGTPQLELTCGAECHRCDAERRIEDRGDDGTRTPSASNDSGGCVHYALDVELAPPPTGFSAVTDPELPCGVVAVLADAQTEAVLRRAWRYATGPPPPGRTITLLSTTVLRE